MAAATRSTPIQKYRLDLHAVLYCEEGHWIAHCLEMDVMGDGESRADALNQLTESVVLQVTHSLDNDNPANIFQPADARFFQMFSAGHGVQGAFEFVKQPSTDNVSIESLESREYSGDLALC